MRTLSHTKFVILFPFHHSNLIIFSLHLEGQTDRHNMTLFLEWDTARDRPIGFEKPCLNFFDSAEDDQDDSNFIHNSVNDKGEEVEETKEKDDGNDDEESDDVANNLNDKELEVVMKKRSQSETSYSQRNDDNRGRIRARPTKIRQSPKKDELYCIRPGCKKKSRFDSSFCSDGCGVWTMEKDLLCSLQYASEMHPYQLRP